MYKKNIFGLPGTVYVHHWKQTCHWKITMFNRKYIFIHGGCSSLSSYLFSGGVIMCDVKWFHYPLIVRSWKMSCTQTWIGGRLFHLLQCIWANSTNDFGLNQVHVCSLPKRYTREDWRFVPENRPLEKGKHLPNHHCQVLCSSSGGVSMFKLDFSAWAVAIHVASGTFRRFGWKKTRQATAYERTLERVCKATSWSLKKA